jgi:hypothetical protein
MAAIAGPSGVSGACCFEMRGFRAGGTATEGGQGAASMRRRVKKLSCKCRKAVPDVLETPSRRRASMHAVLAASMLAGALAERTTEVRRCYPLRSCILCSDVVSIFPLILRGDRSLSNTPCRHSGQQHVLPRSSGQRASPGSCGDMLQHRSMSTSWSRRQSLVLDSVSNLYATCIWHENFKHKTNTC